MPDSPTPERLLDLYKIAIDEYRFEVKLGWDRAMYYLVFNAGLISVAIGLLKIESPPGGYAFIGLVFAFSFCCSVIGCKAIRTSHEYYRRTIVKKTLLEDQRGFTSPVSGYSGRHTLAIGTTTSQGDHMAILNDPEAYIDRKFRRGSVVYLLCVLLLILAGLDLFGVIFAGWLAIHPPRKTSPIPPLFTPVSPSTVHIQSASLGTQRNHG